jgi:hypothetical protein
LDFEDSTPPQRMRKRLGNAFGACWLQYHVSDIEVKECARSADAPAGNPRVQQLQMTRPGALART